MELIEIAAIGRAHELDSAAFGRTGDTLHAENGRRRIDIEER